MHVKVKTLKQQSDQQNNGLSTTVLSQSVEDKMDLQSQNEEKLCRINEKELHLYKVSRNRN